MSNDFDPTVKDREDEQRRIATCAQEPITQLNEIQSHGALLAFDQVTSLVVHRSANAALLLGVDVDRPDANLTDFKTGSSHLEQSHWVDAVLQAARTESPGTVELRANINGSDFDLTVHRVGGLLLADFEPAGPASDAQLWPQLHGAVTLLAATRTFADLCSVAVEQIRRFTGFDRAMVYIFHPDGHGEIIAESRHPDMQPFLGLHYPASDIPTQARALYLTKTCRHTANAAAPACGITPAISPATGQPLSLAMSELRSVSPHHRLFMRNMGASASLSVSLIHDGVLVGMISCNHRTPLHVARPTRRSCEIFATQMGVIWGAMVRAETLTRQLRVLEIRAELIAQMVALDDIGAGLASSNTTLLDLIPADGAAVQIEGVRWTVGSVPSATQLDSMESVIRQLEIERPWSSSDLANDHPAVAEALPEVGGLLIVRLGRGADHVAWFRRPQIKSVNWLGDQTHRNRADPLSPRNSFALWKETLTDQSLPWEQTTIGEALALRDDIEAAMHRRSQSDLAHFGLHDELTGLPNRRMLLEQMDELLSGANPGPLSLLFIDLDHFKEVNDLYGHEVGDALLAEVGHRIREATRLPDVVARLGGDEFMVLCHRADELGAALVAARVIGALQRPLVVDEVVLNVTASVGTATARPGQNTTDLLRDADAAMYRAKNQGRNQYSA